ncbi:hypothetical protein JTB14_007156 [Gonioctena quinquepunctata]|nr:hypothetical protein JTB14_007156 [Gonioctena quinquepunctata]
MKKLDYGTKKEYQSNIDLKINPTLKEFFEIIGARCSALESLAPPSHAAPLEFKSERVSKTSSKTALHVNSSSPSYPTSSVPKNSQNSNYSPRDSPRPQISTGAIPKLVQNTTSSQNWRSPSRNSPTPNADRTAQFRAFEPESQENSSAPSMPSALLVGKEDHEILLATAVVDVLSENGCPVKARLILDNGKFGLADPEFHIPSDVDMLLGADAYYDILLPQIHRLGPKLPTPQLTRLGWVIGGHLPPQIIPKQNKVSLLCQNACEAGDSLDKILAKFWEVEELPEYKSFSADEELAEQSFIQTHVRLENGTFQVDSPFKRPGEKIPLATRVLKELASNSSEFPLAQKALLRQTYVDDVLHGADSLAELEDSYHQLNMLLNSAGFRLHKWSSNSSQFREKYLLVLRNLQSQYFSKEISELRSTKPISDKAILALNPFLNEQDLICVGGRLRHADVPEPQKHPILLPAKNSVVSLLLKREHIRLGHAGAQTVWANVRLQYWPLNGIREVKRVIHECMICSRFRAVAAKQIMSDLPPDRVTLSRLLRK